MRHDHSLHFEFQSDGYWKAESNIRAGLWWDISVDMCGRFIVALSNDEICPQRLFETLVEAKKFAHSREQELRQARKYETVSDCD